MTDQPDFLKAAAKDLVRIASECGCEGQQDCEFCEQEAEEALRHVYVQALERAAEMECWPDSTDDDPHFGDSAQVGWERGQSKMASEIRAEAARVRDGK